MDESPETAPWHDTPPDDIIWAELLDGTLVRFSALRAGDIFRAIFHGVYISPSAPHEPSDSFFRAMEDARPSDGTECAQDYGYCLPIIELDRSEVKKALS